jgi:glyceraldehyde 3-phosphate dehydrogenase
VVDGRRVTYSKERDPAAVGWAALGVEVVLECSGQFLTKAALAPFFGVRLCGLAGIHRFFARFN